MALFKEVAGQFVQWNGEPISGVRHPMNIEEVWTEAELAAVGLYKPLDPDPIPAGKKALLTHPQRVGGKVKYVHTLADFSKAELAEYAANRRWQTETGGITFGGSTIATDDRSKVMITGARVKADLDAGYTTPWKAADGSFVMIDALTIKAISDAVLSHVDNCFRIEEQVMNGINAGTITTYSQIDAAFGAST